MSPASVRATSAYDAPAFRSEVKSWTPVLTDDVGRAAINAARDVAQRLRTPEQVDVAAAVASEQTSFPRSTHWMPCSISQGYAGLAVLWAYLDSCFPEEKWDVTGKQHLELAVRDAESYTEMPFGLYSGLSGLAFATWQLSRDGTRYRRLLLTLDDVISSHRVDRLALNAFAD
jgi:hypothetical protein